MALNPFRKIAVSWILVMAAGSAISQFPPPSIGIVLAIWCVLIAAGVYATAKAFDLKNEDQKNLWLFWTVLCFGVFLENVLSFYVPALSFLLKINIFFLWSVAIGFGYIYTAEKTHWRKIRMYGYLSILSGILFLFPPLLPYQAALFGVIQCGLLGYLAFK